MIDKNYEFLKNQIKFTGFGEKHDENLKTQMAKLQPDFILTHKAASGKDEAVATLHFRKSDTSDMYFFNKYNVLFKKEGDDNILKLMVYLRNKEDNITFKEAVNLLNERSVFQEKTTKEGEKYTTWVKADFKEVDKDGNFKLKSHGSGYDLEKAVAKYPINELKDPDVKPHLIESLQKGNRETVTAVLDGKQTMMFIEAFPESGSNNALKVFDSNLQRVYGLGQENNTTQQNTQHQENVQNQQETSSQKKTSQENKTSNDEETKNTDTKKRSRSNRVH